MAEAHTFTLCPGPHAVASARAAVQEAAEQRVARESLDTLRLLVSEVVTNSVRHGSPREPVDLRINFNSDVLVEVIDRGTGFVPTPRAKPAGEVGGWGLYLVEQLADRWGVARDDVTRVWFTVPAQPAHAVL